MADCQVQQEQQPVIAVKFKKRNKDSLMKKKQLCRTTNDVVVTTVSKVVINAADEEGDNNNEKVINQQSNYSSKDTNENDNDKKEEKEEEEELGTLTAILAIERRRKLLARSRGMDTTSLNKSKRTHQNNDVYNNDEDGGLDTGMPSGGGGISLFPKNDIGETTTGRLGTRTFGVGQLAGSNDMGGGHSNDQNGGGGGGLLERKHRLAMEEFILNNLTAEQGGGGFSSNRSTMVSHQTSDAEKELYAELLLSSVNNNAEREGSIDKKAGGEGDVGAGGAMMGGTGIAEVALPIDERLRVLKATEMAAMEYERARKARFEGGGSEVWGSSMMSQIKNGMNDTPSDLQKIESIAAMVPMTFASGPGKRKRQNDNLTPPVKDDTKSSLSQASTVGGQGISDNYLIESSANIGSGGQYSSTYDVRKSDIADVGASYSHNFQLHTKEWVIRKRDERQTEIDTIHAKQVEDGGPMTSESRARVGFDMARKIARGEMTTGGSVSSGKGGVTKMNAELTNEWDRKKSGTNNHQQSSDDRVWKSFMTNQRNRR